MPSGNCNGSGAAGGAGFPEQPIAKDLQSPAARPIRQPPDKMETPGEPDVGLADTHEPAACQIRPHHRIQSDGNAELCRGSFVDELEIIEITIIALSGISHGSAPEPLGLKIRLMVGTDQRVVLQIGRRA